MRILGIDPGFGRLGWAVIDFDKNKLKLVQLGCFETKAGEEPSLRLLKGFEEIERIVEKFSPDMAAIENLFFFKNAKTVIGVAESRGSVLVALSRRKVPCKSFTPLQVKSAVTGHGRADKIQVQNMVRRLLNLNKDKLQDDAADACAVAIALAFAKA